MTHSVEELDAALLKVMQKQERRTIAKMNKDEATAALEQTNLAMACREYNQLISTAPDEIRVEHRSHLAGIAPVREPTIARSA